MEYRTNHTFHIGAQHLSLGKPCQDYALSGTLNGSAAYAIVSDGCSSGDETDIGARLVALATKRALEENAHLPNLTVERINVVRDAYMETYRRTLGLSHRDMLATCLWALVTPSRVLAHITGDGVITLLYGNEKLITELSWAVNKPYYPAYRLGDIDAAFIEAHKEDPHPFTVTTIHNSEDTQSVTVEEGMLGFAIEHWFGDASDFSGGLQGLVLFSDGVTQVDSYETVAAVHDLTAFKNTNGEYVVRRMNKFLHESKKIGRGPIDDIACAAILITPDTHSDGG